MSAGSDPARAPRVVLVTAPDAAAAASIARALVEERLAACVNLVPGLRSIYRWQGRVEEADEVLLLIKTVEGARAGIERLLARVHPYDLPECVALDVVGVEARYLEWLVEGSGPAAGA